MMWIMDIIVKSRQDKTTMKVVVKVIIHRLLQVFGATSTSTCMHENSLSSAKYDTFHC